MAKTKAAEAEILDPNASTDTSAPTDTLPETLPNGDPLPSASTDTLPETLPNGDPLPSASTEVLPEGSKAIEDLDTIMLEGAPALSEEESAAIKAANEGALAEQIRINNLSAEEFEQEFGFKLEDGLSIIERALENRNYTHKDRIYGLVQKIREICY